MTGCALMMAIAAIDVMNAILDIQFSSAGSEDPAQRTRALLRGACAPLPHSETFARVVLPPVGPHGQYPDCSGTAILHRSAGHRHLRADRELARADPGALQRARPLGFE